MAERREPFVELQVGRTRGRIHLEGHRHRSAAAMGFLMIFGVSP